MKLITVMNKEKALQFIDNLETSNNLLFDFPDNILDEIICKLEDLTGLTTTPVLGVINNVGSLDTMWNKVSTLLPVKSGDVVFQFSVEDDELLYGEFNNVMALLYTGSNSQIDDVFDFDVPNSDKCIALTNLVKADSFESAFVIKDSWEKSSLPGLDSFSSISELKSLCNANIFGG